jgi:hypothetical protein
MEERLKMILEIEKGEKPMAMPATDVSSPRRG